MASDYTNNKPIIHHKTTSDKVWTVVKYGLYGLGLAGLGTFAVMLTAFRSCSNSKELDNMNRGLGALSNLIKNSRIDQTGTILSEHTAEQRLIWERMPFLRTKKDFEDMLETSMKKPVMLFTYSKTGKDNYRHS